MNDQAFLNTPGELLATARRKAGLSLEVLAERTKIPVPMLEAVERDEYHRISDPIYVKSFLRSAATEVGLDPDVILELYGRMTGGTRASAAPEEVWEEQKVIIRRVGLPWIRISTWAGLAAVVVILLLFLVRILGGGDDAVGDQEQSAPAVENQETVQQDDGAEPETSSSQPVVTVGGNGDSQDSLAVGWLAEAPREDPVPEDPPGEEPAPIPSRQAEPVEQASDQPAEETTEPAPVRTEEQSGDTRISSPVVEPVAPTPTTASPEESADQVLPVAAVGGPGLALVAGQPRSQVLRIRTTVALTAEVRRDGERNFTRFVLPGNGAGLATLPTTEIVVGTPYAVQGGVVAYWGARDHFDLVLDRVDGVEVSLNGVLRDLFRVRPGDEMVLDAFHPPSGP